MHALAKMAKMAKIPPTFGEYSYEVAKGSPLRVAILAKWYIWRIWRTFTKISNEMAKGQFESGDFNENGKNGALSPKFGECSSDVAKAPL